MPELVVLMGIQGSGKSTFCRERFYDSHVRINLDMLRTRHRERVLFETTLKLGLSCVIDNTNPARSDRTRYLAAAKQADYTITGYFFEAKIDACLARNARRTGKARIPDAGVRATRNRLEAPSFEEGFGTLYFVRIDENDRFLVEDWKQ
ncbi:AAA family ATPase [Acanthopleuribacter pedis]|uniref:AAA family ATPase n=1 Tax=Acanthopleuribacter pedis TaxID=442870 RepID=A0A8J7QBU0_9BACT|nr:AAA family ATPase [Acanthopleuribacter pedis]MBO1322741.1 AAA family ATPase [Acanthopleuribacter pedis]